MIRAGLIALFSTLMLCGFCGKEFVSLGRHTWRCKSKLDFNDKSNDNVVPAVEIRSQECLPPTVVRIKLSNVVAVKFVKALGV